MKSIAPARLTSVPAEDSGFTADWIRGNADRWLPRHPARESDWAERRAELDGRKPASGVWERAARAAESLGADD